MCPFVTINELQRLSERELHILYRIISDRLPGYAIGSSERRDAIAALGLIRRVIAQRQAQPPKPGL
jgi:hypothetical protein